MFKTRSILNYNHLPLKRCKKDVYTFDHHTNNSKLCIIYGKEMKEIQRLLAIQIQLHSRFVIYCTRKNEKTLKFDLIPKSCFVKCIVFLLFSVFYDVWLVSWLNWLKSKGDTYNSQQKSLSQDHRIISLLCEIHGTRKIGAFYLVILKSKNKTK